MNRKTFIGTIAAGIAALLKLPEKANAAVAAVTTTRTTGAKIFDIMSKIDDERTESKGSASIIIDIPFRCDPDGKVYRRIDGEWVHIATALNDGRRI